MPSDAEDIKAGRRSGHVPSFPNAPLNVWPNMAFLCHADLAWLVRNQNNIVRAWGARPMPVPRPVKAWPNGRVRIEFVGNWPSATDARTELESLLASLAERRKGPSDA